MFRRVALSSRQLPSRQLFSSSAVKLGVKVASIEAGDGKTYPKAGDVVRVHYTGKLTDGSVFDSSVSRGEPLEFPVGVGYVIKGWDEGIPKLSLGEKANLTITPDYGYGSRGAGGVIPPNATLEFEVELIAIKAK